MEWLGLTASNNTEYFQCCRLDNKSAGRQSVGSNLIKPDDEVDDADSMAAYGEGDTGNFVRMRKKKIHLKKQSKKRVAIIPKVRFMIIFFCFSMCHVPANSCFD